jgi:dihydrodipicolinate synthase/N-acetylneuraminate lyase
MEDRIPWVFSIADCRGAWVPLVTPFRSDGGLDLEALARSPSASPHRASQLFWCSERPAKRRTGDMPESEAVVRTVVRAAGGLPVLPAAAGRRRAIRSRRPSA